jgi:hypothetical protein
MRARHRNALTIKDAQHTSLYPISVGFIHLDAPIRGECFDFARLYKNAVQTMPNFVTTLIRKQGRVKDERSRYARQISYMYACK